MAHHHIILCIDDDLDDVTLLQEALQSLDPEHLIITAQNGTTGLEKLRGLKEAGTLPCLIVLDLNMPVMDGRQTFAAIRKDQAFASVPVVIFSTSESALDRMFFSGKNCVYLAKPLSYPDLLETARRFLNICWQL